MLLALLAGGALVYNNVLAQATTPTPAVPGQAQPGLGKGPGMRGGYSEQDLATALGIDLTKLQAAYKAANTEALKEAVSLGLITQAQADQITARGIDNRPLGGFFFGQQGSSSINYNALLANALGISTDQLQAAYTKAFNTSLDNAVKAGTITQAQADLEKGRYALGNDAKFQASLKSAFEAAVKQAVTDGVISQAQADQILKAESNAGAPGFLGGFDGFRGGPGGFGPGHPGRGMGGGWFGQPPAQPQPTATPGSSS